MRGEVYDQFWVEKILIASTGNTEMIKGDDPYSTTGYIENSSNEGARKVIQDLYLNPR